MKMISAKRVKNIIDNYRTNFRRFYEPKSDIEETV